MKTRSKLAALRRDFESVRGAPFDHFYCPILFRDENVTLCHAHLVNQAFPDAPPSWTVQRKDVDEFFGSRFEAEFINLQHKGKYTPDEILVDRALSKQLDPRIEIDGKSVDYYVPSGQVPDEHVKAEFRSPSGSVTLGLKLRPDEALQLSTDSGQIVIEKDLRIPVLVSLIKSAHLTLFEMLGYRWALSAAGHFVGYDILGSFFLKHAKRKKRVVLASSMSHFAEFANMVRPVLSGGSDFDGTITSGRVYVCKEPNANAWALIVFIRIAQALHAVLLPLFELWAVKRFLDFLVNDVDEIAVADVCFQDQAWHGAAETRTIHWPKPAHFINGETSPITP